MAYPAKALVALVMLCAIGGMTHGQSKPERGPGGYPTKPIRIIVGASPGGGTD